MVEVCTNVSLRARRRAGGARGVRARARRRAGRDDRGRRVHAARRRVPRRLRLRRRSSPSTTATASRSTPDDVPGDRAGAARCRLERRREPASSSPARTSAPLTRLAATARSAATRSSSGRARWSRRQVIERAARVEPARPRRRLLPDRPQGELHPEPDSAKPTYLTVNADESEPGTFKDREIMLRVPHRLIEGCLITAHAIQSKHVFIYIRGEYLDRVRGARARRSTRRAQPACSAASRSSLHRGAGAYICGEETALLESLEGKRGQPRSKPPFPAISGPLRVADADQQRRDDRERAEGDRARRRRVRDRSARRRTRPARASSPSPATSCNGGQLRAAERHDAAAS